MKVEKFVKEIKKQYEKTKTILKKSQKIKKYVDRNGKRVVKYKVVSYSIIF